MCEPSSIWTQILPPAVGGIIGALVAGGVGLYVHYHQRSRIARDDFLRTISDLKDTLHTKSSSGETEQFYSASLPLIGKAISRVEPFIGKKRSVNIHAVWTAYQKQDRKELSI